MKFIRNYGAALGAALFWGFSFVWSKSALEHFNPSTVVFFRLLIAASVMWTVGIVSGFLQKLNRTELKSIVLLSLFEPFLYFVGETNGLVHSSSTTAAVVIATIPLFAPFIAWFVFKDKIHSLQIVGALISIIGVGMVILKNDFTLKSTPAGLLFLFLAVASAEAYTVIVMKIPHRINVYTIVTYQSIIGAILFSPLVFIFDLQSIISATYTFATLAPIVLLGIFASSVAFLLFTYSIKHLGMVAAATFSNIIPVFTAVFAFFLIGEKLTFLNWVGMLIVIAGLFVAQLRRKTTGQKNE